MNWGERYSQLLKNKPESYDSYHNQSFVDRMNQAKQDIDRFAKEESRAETAKQGALDQYNTFQGQMQNFGSIHKQAENEFGVKTALSQYEKSKEAIRATELAMAALPSNITANSNVALSQSQRERAYQALSGRLNNQMRTQMQGAKVYEQAWKNARQSSLLKTQAVYRGEWDKLQDFNNAWVSATKDLYDASKRTRDARFAEQNLSNQYRQWQHIQSQMAQNKWAAEVNSAFAKMITDSRERMEKIQLEEKRRKAGVEAKTQEKLAPIYLWRSKRLQGLV